ncbi:MAG: argininosuccinate lyase [Eubacteriales bacterium]|jgi:argininosuccinate lyase
MALWGARFSKEVDKEVNDFNSSIRFDSRMYQEDITGSIAHATMLAKQGILTPQERDEIIAGLQGILADIQSGAIQFPEDAEDIHMTVETILTQRIGDNGKRLHTARSRNDQVAVDIRLYTRREIGEIRSLLLHLLEVLADKAKQHTDTIMPGYTHLQRAQPITFAHHLMAYAQMFRRDVTRLSDCLVRMDEMPLGAGALATTTHPIDRAYTAQLLGFARPTDNSLDSVSDRDFLIELASDISLVMMHLSRFSEEIILWCSSEFGFIELDDAYSTGSSIMPQKKNPDIAELVRGKTGRVYGDLMTLLTMMKGIPLAYNKDMQEDKEAIFDAIDTVKLCLSVFASMLETTTVRAQTMRRAAAGGFTNATDCADYLAKKGIPFRDAYKVVGQMVAHCIEIGKPIEELTLEELQAIHPVFGPDVYREVSLEACVEGRKAIGGPAPDAVRQQIQHIEEFLKQEKQREEGI